MSNPTTAANPLHLAQFAAQCWRAERAAGDVSHQQLEPLLARWNQARVAAGLPVNSLDVHVGVMLHSYLNIDDWVFSVARAFAAADGRYLDPTWPPGSPTLRLWVQVGPDADPDVVVSVADAGLLAQLAAVGPERVPGPADVDPALAGVGDASDPASASWTLGNLGPASFPARRPDEGDDPAGLPPPATLVCLGPAGAAPGGPAGGMPAAPARPVDGKRPLTLDRDRSDP